MSYPEEMSIVGFDDLILPSILQTQLTVMGQPMVEMSKKTVNLLLRRIDGKKEPKVEHIVLEPVFLEGNSVRYLKN